MPEACHLCGAAGLKEFAAFPTLARVTSDCRPFRPGGRLASCPTCGALQKVADAALAADCKEIYAGYRLYHQGEGQEQRIFDQHSGSSRPRSALILDHLERFLSREAPAAGRLLDIGCGEGFFLAAFGRRFPGWRLSGLDMGGRYRATVLGLPGVEDYFDGDPALAAGPYDLVTLNHTLEHIPGPATYLERVQGLLRPGGLLLVNVPDWTANPFDLAVADHCTHFTEPVLARALARAGLAPLSLDRTAIPKEWLAVARAGDPASGPDPAPADRAAAQAALDWLGRFAAGARDAAAGRRLGIFGTAIAGVWLDAALAGRAEFFVDEDPGRAGSAFMGRPVHLPCQVPAGAAVVLAFPPAVARGIAGRLAGLPFDLMIPED
ncbi:MAG: methyltransferase domain-containing protein [Thermodesulfobacteriota bacterium]